MIIDDFTQSTMDKVSNALAAAGHKRLQDGAEGHSGFKITAAGTPGTIRLTYMLHTHHTGSGGGRPAPARILERLGRYTLELLTVYDVHLVCTKHYRYLLVRQRTVEAQNEIRLIMIRAALMDLPPGYTAQLEPGDRDTTRVTFTAPENTEPDRVKTVTATALRDAERLLNEQGWQVINQVSRQALFVWESPFSDIQSL